MHITILSKVNAVDWMYSFEWCLKVLLLAEITADVRTADSDTECASGPVLNACSPPTTLYSWMVLIFAKE